MEGDCYRSRKLKRCHFKGLGGVLGAVFRRRREQARR